MYTIERNNFYYNASNFSYYGYIHCWKVINIYQKIDYVSKYFSSRIYINLC